MKLRAAAIDHAGSEAPPRAPVHILVLPGSGIHEGKEDARRTLEQAVGAWDKFQLTIDEIHEGENNTVIALGHSDVGKGGDEATLPVVHIWRFEDGTPKRLQILTDTYSSAKLLGEA